MPRPACRCSPSSPPSRDRGRPAAAGEGVRRRRRPRHARRPRPRRPARRGRARRAAEAASAFGDGTVFVEPYVERGRHVEVQVSATATARRWCSASATARSSAATRRSSRRRPPRASPTRPARALHDAARAAARGDRLRRRRHRRVPLDAGGRPLLLPGDEHPPAGRAPGHRVRAPASTWSSCSSRVAEGARARRAPIGEHLRATRSRCGSTPRTRPHDWQPQSGRLDAVRRPGRRRRVRPARPATASGSTPGSSRAARSRTHYDAMLAKVIAWAPTRDRGRRACWPAPSPGPAPRRRSPTATCWSTCCGDPAFLAGRRRHRLPRAAAASARRPRPRPTRARRCSPPRVALAERDGRAAAPCSAASRSAGATWSPSRSAPRFDGRRRRRATVVGVVTAVADGYVRRRARASSSATPDRRGRSRCDGVDRRVVRRGASTRRPVEVSSTAARVAAAAACPGSSTRPTRSRSGSLLAPMPGHGRHASPSSDGADGRRRADRCWCSRR